MAHNVLRLGRSLGFIIQIYCFKTKHPNTKQTLNKAINPNCAKPLLPAVRICVFSAFKSSSFSFSFQVFQFLPLLKKIRFRRFKFSCQFLLLKCFKFHFLSTISLRFSVRFQFFCPISFSRNFLIKFRQKKKRKTTKLKHSLFFL